MPKHAVLKNRHPVDRLFDLREQIKLLQEEEKAVRADIMSSGDMVGSDYVAMAKSSTQNRLDRDALNARFGKKEVDTCLKPVEVTTLNLFRKADMVAKVDIFA